MTLPSDRQEPAYLHDPNAEVDVEIAALEHALAPLRFRGGAPSEQVLGVRSARSVGGSARWLVGSTLAAAAAMVLFWLWPESALEPGSAARRFVTEGAAVTINLGQLAQVELQPNSELEFVHWRGDDAPQALFRLTRGGLTATVAPPPRVPPGFFIIETSGATVVDQGCRFELVVDAHGQARVFVEEGAVTFAGKDRQVFVPAGARAMVTSSGIGTPTFLETSSVLKQLVAKFDQFVSARPSKGKGPPRQVDLARKLAFSCENPRDTLPLYHLLLVSNPTVRKVATGALFDLAGSPGGQGTNRAYTPDEWLGWLRTTAWQSGN